MSFLSKPNLVRVVIASGDFIRSMICPSMEDKIVRFGERDGHEILLEPEGLDDTTV